MAITAATQDIYGTTEAGVYSDIAVSVNPTRIIFKCKTKACKRVWAHEYRKVFRQMAETKYLRTGKLFRIEAVYTTIRFENGKRVRYEEDYNCPDCGKRGESSVVVGVLNETHKCDARCMSAKNGACECSCAGANHGVAHL